MAEPKAKIRFTYEDYKTLPESKTKRYELLGGELVMVPSPAESHQRISRDLEFILWKFVQEKGLGRVYYAPLDVVLHSPLLVGLAIDLKGVFARPEQSAAWEVPQSQCARSASSLSCSAGMLQFKI